MEAAERIRVFRVAGLTGRLDRHVGIFGERQQLGLKAIGSLAAAPWRHGHVVEDQLEPRVTLGPTVGRNNAAASATGTPARSAAAIANRGSVIHSRLCRSLK
jgi:hypothetical protein